MSAKTALLLTSLIVCGFASSAATAATPAQPAAAETVLDTGQASWYNAGLRTFSGERFNPRRMTAAHTTLPIGTMVRVTDMATGRSVIVRVNDRLPPHGVRCIDLSEGAATALGMHNRGLADVTLTAVATQPATTEGIVEVAEAPDGASAIDAPHHASARHGRQHRHHAAQ
jgi:rare lipoprotein A